MGLENRESFRNRTPFGDCGRAVQVVWCPQNVRGWTRTRSDALVLVVASSAAAYDEIGEPTDHGSDTRKADDGKSDDHNEPKLLDFGPDVFNVLLVFKLNAVGHSHGSHLSQRCCQRVHAMCRQSLT